MPIQAKPAPANPEPRVFLCGEVACACMKHHPVEQAKIAAAVQRQVGEVRKARGVH